MSLGTLQQIGVGILTMLAPFVFMKPSNKYRLSKIGDAFSKDLVKRATEYELIMQEALMDAGIIFEFQKPLICGKSLYIADFYLECRDKKLVIEIDGGKHYTNLGFRKDQKRTSKMKQSKGIEVIRYPNSQLLHRMPYILAEIMEYNPRIIVIPA